MQCSKVQKKNDILISVLPNNVACYVQKYSVQCTVSRIIQINTCCVKVIYDHGREQEQIKGLKLSKPKSE